MLYPEECAGGDRSKRERKALHWSIPVSLGNNLRFSCCRYQPEIIAYCPSWPEVLFCVAAFGVHADIGGGIIH
jgi:hypothetical protein